MADLSKGTRGINILVTALNRHRATTGSGGGWEQIVDAQVDYRDPQGRTQTNPHLASRRVATPAGRNLPEMTARYTSQDMEAIAEAAGERGTFELRDAGGQPVGVMYAVKADLVPSDQAPMDQAPIGAVPVERAQGSRNLGVDARTVRASDFDVDLGTRDAQFKNMLEARRSQRFYEGVSTDYERVQHTTTLTAAERARGMQPVQLYTTALHEARTAEQLRLMPDLDHGQHQGQHHGLGTGQRSAPARRSESYTPDQLAEIRETSAARRGTTSQVMNSQAGLAATRGPMRSVPSSPAPGEPGSRFNPNLAEPRPAIEPRSHPQTPPAPGMVRPADVPRVQPRPGQVVQAAGSHNGTKRVDADVVFEAGSNAARATQSGASNKGVLTSAAKGAAVGTVHGLRTGMASRGAQPGPSGERVEQGMTQVGMTQQPAGSSSGMGLVARLGGVVETGTLEQKGSQQDRRPLSQTFDYQFDGKDWPDSIEPQHGA